MWGKATSKGNSKGGKSKSKGSAELITKQVALQTSSEHILVLRSALRDEDGQDKNILQDYQKCAKFNKNGLDLVYEFYTSLPRSLFKFCFGLSRSNLEKSYNSCGYGWVDDEKKGELKQPEARFLLIRRRTSAEINGTDSKEEQDKKEYVGFVNLRFTLTGEVVDENSGEPCLMLYDLQLIPEVQRKGVGKYTMMLLELIAKKQKMLHMMAPVVKHNPAAHSFFTKAVRGFGLDKEYGQDETQAILSKSLKPPAPKVAKTPVAAPLAAEEKTHKADKADKADKAEKSPAEVALAAKPAASDEAVTTAPVPATKAVQAAAVEESSQEAVTG